ncbi:type II secretion system F family protein [Paenibacillus validus]|uniref:Type II secretion system F family protein n=1 Tax=Paenibacillus validus TaxID=44253 RepID=A0A7X3CQV4_9BACL|nr:MULTISPECIES: type II secretion system F family protein [Paenibacillus]MED4603477.1 type II secretion system F family protein [Paenibacillus validus]MED4608845.1 type II secretion system F family protein [Paenibacillus validus]MUG69592.1 type II secretion system F family protein [Paenibacillus validus]
MPKFDYKAVDDYGRYYKGTLEAKTFHQAMEELKGKGLWILELIDQSKSLLRKELKFGGGPKVKTEHFTVFCRQLATLYKSGINLVEAVRVLSEQTESKEFRKILTSVSEEMARGTQFSAAAAHYPTVFTGIFINMIRAGEASGNLDEMLTRLAIFYEKEYYTKQKVKSAMVYPAIMGVVTVIVVIILMTFVVPRLVGNFATMGLELPLPTRIVIAVSDWMKQFWYVVMMFLLVPSFLLRMLKKHPKGVYGLDYIKLKLPVFGKLWHKQSLSRFSRTFCSLFAAAIPMLQMMSIVSTVVGNEVIAKLIRDSREGLRAGNSIAEPFKNSWLFPPMVVQMLQVGERTGALDTMLEKVAEFYEADVDAMADRLKALLEPIMILILAVIVGGIVLAVMLPSFKLMENMGG